MIDYLKALVSALAGAWIMLDARVSTLHVEPEAAGENPREWRALPDAPLKDLARPHGIRVGAAIAVDALRTDREYRRLVAREFDMVVAENAMKMDWTQPKPGQWNFDGADDVIGFARAHGMQIRGHTLIWHGGLPKWMQQTEWGEDELREVMLNRIRTLVGRYRGLVGSWDVVNEAYSGLWGVRETVWTKVLGEGAIDEAFFAAHAADPAARLFYNDFLIETDRRKTDIVVEKIRGMLDRGVPIHGIGIQGHLHFGPPHRDELVDIMRRFADLGLEIHFTEVDVALISPDSPGKRIAQAVQFRRLVDACRQVKACTAIVFWGVDDRRSWITRFFPGYEAPLLFDGSYRRKLPYWAVAKGLAAPTPQ